MYQFINTSLLIFFPTNLLFPNKFEIFVGLAHYKRKKEEEEEKKEIFLKIIYFLYKITISCHLIN